MLNIGVCVKQVPDSRDVSVAEGKGTLVRENCERIMNPADMHALEMAFSLKERYGGMVTVLTMGPLHAREVLFEAYAMGADRCVLISDERFAGSDATVTAKILSRAIYKLGRFDVLVTGVESIDGNTGSVGYYLSESLEMPLVSRIHAVSIEKNIARVERIYGHEYQTIRVRLPVLMSVNRETNSVRYTRMADIKTCFEKKITLLTFDDIGGSKNEYGLEGSPTVLLGYESFSHKRVCKEIGGNLSQQVETVMQILKKQTVLRY